MCTDLHTCTLYDYPYPPPPPSPPSSSLDLYKEFQEEAYSVALHPSGLFVLVGFSEKLRLMNLLIDDIRPFKEFMIRGCREVYVIKTLSTNLKLLLLFSLCSYPTRLPCTMCLCYQLLLQGHNFPSNFFTNSVLCGSYRVHAI